MGWPGPACRPEALLEFTLDHARARDAVHAGFDVAAIMQGLGDLGLEASQCFKSGPATGRIISGVRISGACWIRNSRHRLANRAGGPHRLAIVIGDGLSPAAVNAHAIALLRSLVPQLAADGIEIGHAVVATGARVALGDEIGAILGARMIAMLIGERPGLSAADSLGVYLTFDPKVGTTDEKRNCVSNIHRAGLGYDEAAFRIAWLIREGLARELTGVALKDESGGRPSQLSPQIRANMTKSEASGPLSACAPFVCSCLRDAV